MTNNFSTDFYGYNKTALSTVNTNFQNNVVNNPFATTNNAQNSVFSSGVSSGTVGDTTSARYGVDQLKADFQAVKDKQGIIGKAWDGLKNLLGVGLSSGDVEDAIKQYEAGQISYDEVQEQVQKFSQKQSGMTDIITNIASGLIVAGTAVATGGLSLGVVATGAAIGGAAKAGIKTLDRATNNVEGDALDAKQIVKDGLTGAIDGAVTVATAGMVKPLSGAAGSVKEAVKQGAIQGAKAGAISGAVVGAGNYTVEAAFEDDVDFTFEGLFGATVQSAAIGGAIGGVAGGVSNGIKQTKINAEVKAQAEIKPLTQRRVEDAIDEMESGTSYAEARETATKNLTHDEKRIVKQELSEVRSKQIQQEKGLEIERAESVRTAESAKADVHEAGFGIKNLTDEDAVTARTELAKTSAKEAQVAADRAKEIADANPTHRNQKAARIAQNKASRAEAEATRIKDAGEAQIERINNGTVEVGHSKAMVLDKKTENGILKEISKFKKRHLSLEQIQQKAASATSRVEKLAAQRYLEELTKAAAK